MKGLKVILLSLSLVAAARSQGQQRPEDQVSLVERTTNVIDFVDQTGAIRLDLEGTCLFPEAHGEATVERKRDHIEIDGEFDNLQDATRFGPEYLTFVMWGISPEGRTTNLGEVVPNGTKTRFNVTSELHAFGLIVTAEPYFAVSQPNDKVVIESVVKPDTLGKIGKIETKYDLLPRGTYTLNAPTPLKAIAMQIAELADPPDVHLFVGARRAEGLYDLPDLEKLGALEPWLTVTPCVSDDPDYWGECGSLPDVVARSGSWAGREAYLAGPTPMVQGMAAKLAAQGVPQKQVHVEDFGWSEP